MKLLSCVAENFGSYKQLIWDYADTGLALIYGPTGSGKSTFEDVACWALFGRTAKDGAVDDIKSWNSTERTQVTLAVSTPEGNIIVVRTRGKPGENDLYWFETSDAAQAFDEIRGTDLSDTQKRLNARLGVDFDLYFAGAYFSEFSDVASFFTAKAKERRALVDKVVSMEFPNKLTANITDAKKDTKKELEEARIRLAKETSKGDQLEAMAKSLQARAEAWDSDQNALIAKLSKSIANFDRDKAVKKGALQISHTAWEADRAARVDANTLEIAAAEAALIDLEPLQAKLKAYDGKDTRCSKCGRSGDSSHTLEYVKLNNELQSAKTENRIKQDKIARRLDDLEKLASSTNPVRAQLDALESSASGLEAQLAAERSKANPFFAEHAKVCAEMGQAIKQEAAASLALDTLSQKISSLDQLADITSKFRGERLQTAVRSIQDETNRYLECYFDAEIRIMLSLPGADTLEVSLFKDGHPCNYKQLSKGQRGLLKLCFSLTIMHAVANKAGVHFDSIFLDEALDGLDASLKIKSFRLLQELATKHSSVYIIDHSSELQELFDKRYHVTLADGESKVEEE